MNRLRLLVFSTGLLVVVVSGVSLTQEFCDGVCSEDDLDDPQSECYFQDCLSEENEPSILENADASLSRPARLRNRSRPQSQNQKITVRSTGAKYKAVSQLPSGWFQTGQKADIALSSLGFNEAGGSLLFNHPMGVASDGKRLLLTDTYNNRVLIWNKLPEGNMAPDLVLGQKDFHGNDSGSGRNQMNWPVALATDGRRIIVADTENHRLLIWNSWPQKNGTPADLVINGAESQTGLQPAKNRFHWPWGVWTDGEKLAVVSTRGGWLLIWNHFPTTQNQSADVMVTGMGTPRQITSDGKSLIIGDHNARPGDHASGSWFWKKFPLSDGDKPDFFLQDQHGGTWYRGSFLRDGRLALLARTLSLWSSFPSDENSRPDFSVEGFQFKGGDHVTSVEAGGKFYICAGNRNQILVYNKLPDSSDDYPDFAIGSPDIKTDTLQENFIISNPVPASNGQSLFVASDFDRKFYVWKNLPDQSGAHPDFVYDMPEGAWDLALWKDRLVLAGQRSVFIWNKLPVNGELPDLMLRGKIGGIDFQGIKGVALDDRYFYLADTEKNKVYVWEGIPSQSQSPKFELSFEHPGRITSDGRYLAIAPVVGPAIEVYEVSSLSNQATPKFIGEPRRRGPQSNRRHGEKKSMFNSASSAEIAHGHLFVTETASGKVHIWQDIKDALEGKWADVILGAQDFDDVTQETAQDKMHFPASSSFDGHFLWVGETKFSERLLRFSLK